MARDTIERVGDDDLGLIDPDSLVIGTDNGSGGNGNDASRGDYDFDPSVHIGRDRRNADGSYRRKRGAGSGQPRAGTGQQRSRQSEKSPRLTVTAIEALLVSTHATAAAVLRDPRWLLTEDEAPQLAKALHEANKYLPSAKLDPRWIAFGNLAYVATLIYGTRAYAMYMEGRERAAAKSQPPPGIGARPHAHGATPPPPSETTPGPIPATATNANGAATQTHYQKVAPGLVDEATLAAAMQGLGIKT